MISKAEKESLKAIIADTVTLLCKNGLNAKFNKNFCIDGLIGITLDEDELMLVSIKELVENPNPPPENSSSDDSGAEDGSSKVGSSRKRKRRRRRSRDSMSDASSMSRLNDTPSGTPAKRGLFHTGDGDNGSFFSQDQDNFNVTLQDIKHDESDDDLIEIIKEEPGLTQPDTSDTEKLKKTQITATTKVNKGDMGSRLIDGTFDDDSSSEEKSNDAKDGSGSNVRPEQEPNPQSFLDEAYESTENMEIVEESGMDDEAARVVLDESAAYGALEEETAEEEQFEDLPFEEFEAKPSTSAGSGDLLVCSSCGECFKKLSTLRKHKCGSIDGEGSEKEGKVCDECGCQQPSLETLRHHKEVVHGITEIREMLPDDKASLQCPICHKVMKSPYYFQEHLQKHNEGPTCECERCGASFKFSSSLRRHVKICLDVGQHSQNLSCEHCGEMFSGPHEWQEHCSKVHNEEKKLFLCDFTNCHKPFIRKSALRGHVLMSHTNVAVAASGVSCDVCNKIFPTKYHLKEHMLTHSNVPKGKCMHCGRQFKHPRSMKAHMQCCPGLVSSSVKKFRCTECDATFRTKSLLDQHFKGKHEGRSHGICDMCGREFNWRTSYMNHVKSCKGNIKEKKPAASIKPDESFTVKDESVALTFAEENFGYPASVGQEVVVLPLYEGGAEEYILTTEHGTEGHETVGATQEIVAEIVPEDQFYFQEGLHPVTYVNEDGEQYFVTQEGVKGELGDEFSLQ